MQDHYQFTADMKKILVLSMLVSFVMICSCQKKESADQQQLAQLKVELDAREEALAERKSALDERERTLDERQKALDEREKALAQKQKGTVNDRTNPSDVQDPAQVQAERDRVIQQFSAMVPELSQLQGEKAEREREIEEQRAQSQPRLEELERASQHKMEGTSGGGVFPAPAATLPIPSPAVEATSPSPSPTPQ